MGVFENLLSTAIDFVNVWSSHEQYGALVKLALITIPMIIYAIFIFYFYRFIARKNIIELNLNQYNTSSSGFFSTVIPIVFYFIEYIIIMPFITFIWFGFFSLLILFLASELPLETVLLISAALITSVRVTSFVSENLSQDLAKMLPLTLLGIALTNPIFFNFSGHLAKISQIPTLLNEVISFLAFIIIIEFIMRMFDLSSQRTYLSKAMKGGIAVEGEDD